LKDLIKDPASKIKPLNSQVENLDKLMEFKNVQPADDQLTSRAAVKTFGKQNQHEIHTYFGPLKVSDPCFELPHDAHQLRHCAATTKTQSLEQYKERILNHIKNYTLKSWRTLKQR
jgi:HPt (histidine-containing phosphotransfer) domain-containing protein